MSDYVTVHTTLDTPAEEPKTITPYFPGDRVHEPAAPAREWWVTLYHPNSVCKHAGYMYEERKFATGGYDTIRVREVLPGDEAIWRDRCRIADQALIHYKRFSDQLEADLAKAKEVIDKLQADQHADRLARQEAEHAAAYEYKQRKLAAADLAEATVERDVLKQSVDDMGESIVRLTADLQHVTADRDRLAKQLQTETENAMGVVRDMDRLRGEAEKLRTCRRVDAEQWSELQMLIADRDRLERRVAALEAHAANKELHWQEYEPAAIQSDPVSGAVSTTPLTDPQPDPAMMQEATEAYARGDWSPIEDLIEAHPDPTTVAAARQAAREGRGGTIEEIIATLSTPPTTDETVTVPDAEYRREVLDTREPRTCYRVMQGETSFGTSSDRGAAERWLETFDMAEIVEFREVLRDSTGQELLPAEVQAMLDEMRSRDDEVQRLRKLVEQFKSDRDQERAWRQDAGHQAAEGHREVERLTSELADYKARHETSLEVIRAREQEVRQLRETLSDQSHELNESRLKHKVQWENALDLLKQCEAMRTDIGVMQTDLDEAKAESASLRNEVADAFERGKRTGEAEIQRIYEVQKTLAMDVQRLTAERDVLKRQLAIATGYIKAAMHGLLAYPKAAATDCINQIQAADAAREGK